ncbi:MAG: ImuA family protein [Hyphomicrobiales bacterium]
MNPSVTQLRRQLEALTPRDHTWRTRGQLALGVSAIDEHLKGGLPLGLLHEAYAGETADMAATSGFAAALVQRAALSNRPEDARSIVWIRQTMSESETGRLYPHGLSGIGLDPANLISVRVGKPIHLLSAGLEAVRCTSLSAVVIEAWGAPKELDLTSTRRLTLAAEQSGTTPFLLRAATQEQASTAFTRWQVRAAPSRALAAGAPGYPTFDITLLRNKAGTHGHSWRVEWHHELGQFRSIQAEQTITATTGEKSSTGQPLPGESVSGGVVSVSARRSLKAAGKPLARTG